MDATIKRKWVEALRSGEYKQGQGALRDARDNTWCCLGVLCEVSGLGEWGARVNDFVEFRYGGMASALLPTDGFTEAIKASSELHVYAHMNDHEGMTFAEIADEVERRESDD